MKVYWGGEIKTVSSGILDNVVLNPLFMKEGTYLEYHMLTNEELRDLVMDALEAKNIHEFMDKHKIWITLLIKKWK